MLIYIFNAIREITSILTKQIKSITTYIIQNQSTLCMTNATQKALDKWVITVNLTWPRLYLSGKFVSYKRLHNYMVAFKVPFF